MFIREFVYFLCYQIYWRNVGYTISLFYFMISIGSVVMPF